MDILPLWQEGSLGVSRDLWSERRCSISLRGMRRRPPPLRKTPNPSADSHCRRDVSNRHAAVCFRVMPCDFCMLLFLLRLPLHVADTLCHLTPAPRQTKLYFFYECLQYLLEAKKAQQSLESTYKQLDSVSLEEEEVKLMYSIHIWSQ